jgi:hypothetical protein
MPIYSYAELKGKIKVGDKVRAVNGKENGCQELGDVESTDVQNEKICEITAVNGGYFSINDCPHGYHSESFLELLTEEKTLDTVDVGDVVVSEDGNERTILDKSPNGTVLFLSRINDATHYQDGYTRQEIKHYKLTVKQSTPAPAPKEMTLEEVSKALGYPVKIVE